MVKVIGAVHLSEVVWAGGWPELGVEPDGVDVMLICQTDAEQKQTNSQLLARSQKLQYFHLKIWSLSTYWYTQAKEQRKSKVPETNFSTFLLHSENGFH